MKQMSGFVLVLLLLIDCVFINENPLLLISDIPTSARVNQGFAVISLAFAQDSVKRQSTGLGFTLFSTVSCHTSDLEPTCMLIVIHKY